MLKIKVEEGAFMPERAHKTDAGLDIKSPASVYLRPKDSVVIDTGVHVELPHGTAGLLVSKSGLNVKFGILSTGLIDEGYTGSIRVKLYNHSSEPYMIERGAKISQLVIVPVFYCEPEQVDHLEETERGDAGFGSTGR